MYQLAFLWEAAFSFSDFFFFLKTLSVHLLIAWWVIYKHTCPHLTECSAVFDQKWHDPCAPPSLCTWFHPKLLFFCLFAQRKNVLKGKHFVIWKRWNKKVRSTKRQKIDDFKNCFEQWKKVSIGVLHQMKSTLKVRTPLNTCVTSHSYVSSQCLSFLISKMAK